MLHGMLLDEFRGCAARAKELSVPPTTIEDIARGAGFRN
jgi:hypothetical protein